MPTFGPEPIGQTGLVKMNASITATLEWSHVAP